jgi:Fe2+ or Zn2+ uptake regulation protein
LDDLGGPPVDLAAKHHDFVGYEILGHRLEFVGICAQCRQHENETTL